MAFKDPLIYVMNSRSNKKFPEDKRNNLKEIVKSFEAFKSELGPKHDIFIEIANVLKARNCDWSGLDNKKVKKFYY